MGKRLYDWTQIQRHYDEGHGFVECQNSFGVTHTAWRKAIRRGDLKTLPRPFSDRRRRYDWAKIQAYLDAGFTYKECAIRFGFRAETWAAAVKRGEVSGRTRTFPIDVMFRRKMARRSIKARLLELRLLDDRCSRCGLSEWRGRPITIHLDHINGVKDDWRLENIRMLCPNCHSQTPTFSGRNARRPGQADL